MSLEFEERTGQILRMHTGINTGLVVTGTSNINKGQDGFSGQTINIASRLTDTAQADEILIGYNTFDKAKAHILAEPVSYENKDLFNDYEGLIYRVRGFSKHSKFAARTENKVTPFVGRARELGLLLDLFRESQKGAPLAVDIVSNPGEGKSRLLYEFKKNITSRNVVFLESKCFSFHQNTAYFPIINQLEEYFNIQDADDDPVISQKVEKGLARLGLANSNTIPYIFQLLSIKSSETKKYPLKSEELKDHIVRLTRQLIISSSRIQPIIISVEDLHWIDKSSEGYLYEVFRDLPDSRVFFIFTHRTGYSTPWKNMSQAYEISLKPLKTHEARTMIKNLLRTKRLASNLEKLLLEETRGVPFFIEEFIRSLIDKQEIKRKGGKAYLEKELKSLAIPSSIHDLISSRIDSLPKGAKDFLQKISVAGRVFNFDIIMVLTGFSEEKVLNYLSVLRDSQFLDLQESRQDRQYHFKHSLLQEVAYAGILIRKRKQIHNHMATVIEKRYSYKLDQFCEILAYHYTKSGNSGKAFQYLMLAGRKAISNYSNREAFHLLKSAAEVAGKGFEEKHSKEKRVEALKLALIPMVRLGYPKDSLKIISEGADLSMEIGDERSLASFYDLMGNYYTAKGKDPFLGIRYSEKCLNLLEKIEDRSLLAKVSRGLCGSYIVVGEPRKSVKLAEKVIDILERDDHKQDVIGGGLCLSVLKALLAHSHGWLGNFVEAEIWAEKALSCIQDTENYHDLAYVHFLCGYLYVHSGEGRKSIQHFDKCIHCCEEGKVVLWLGLGWTGLGMGYLFSEDLDSARECIFKGITFQKDLSIPYYLSFHLLALGVLFCNSGDLKPAQYFLQNALKLSVKYGEKWIEGVSKIYLGSIWGQSNSGTKAEEAEAFIQQGIEMLVERKILPWSSIGYLLLGQFYASNGHTKKAVEFLKKAEVLFNEMNMEYWLRLSRKSLQTLPDEADLNG